MGRVLTSLACAMAVTAAPAVAFGYDESTSPDLSNDPATPTALSFVVGSNQVKGTVRNTSPQDTRDYFKFTVAPNQQLVAINLLSYTNIVGGGPGNTGFHAINAGATSENPDPAGNNVDFYLGGDHLVSLGPSENLLVALADGTPAGTGFTVPLGPGTYTYLVQQVSGATAYDLRFVVTGPADAKAPAGNAWLRALLAALLAVSLVLRRRAPLWRGRSFEPT